MSSAQGSPLLDLEAALHDNTTSLTLLLHKCLLLGGRSGSQLLRQWAKRELDGYADVPEADLPDYRRVGGVICVDAVVGYNIIEGRAITAFDLPKAMRDRGINEVLPIPTGVGEIEDLVNRGDVTLKLSRFGSANAAALMNAEIQEEFQEITAVYWKVHVSAMHNVLVLIRTKMVEMVAELLAALPQGETAPSKELVDDVVGVVIHGDNTHVTVVHTTAGTTTPTIASGANSTAVGTQTATGDGATVVGSQAVHGNDNTVAGRDATAPSPTNEQPKQGGWWTRLRKRGVLVAFMTIVAGVVTVFTWIGWKPWE